MNYSLEQSVIRILDKEKRPHATGIVLDNNLAVTCTHNILSVNSKPGDSVLIQFILTGRYQEAQVLVDGWSSEEDIAFLKLESIPSRVSPVILGSAVGRMGHMYIALGVSEIRAFEALWLYDVILGMVSETEPGRYPKLQLKSENILSGMSGAPVFDVEVQRVIGIIQSVYMRKDIPRIAWATTSDTLATLNSSLKLWPDIYGPGRSDNQKEQTRLQLMKLRQFLIVGFNESELQDLCFDFGVDYEELAGSRKGDKVRELIAYFERRGRVEELIEVVQNLRPNISFA